MLILFLQEWMIVMNVADILPVSCPTDLFRLGNRQLCVARFPLGWIPDNFDVRYYNFYRMEQRP
jgi:hypothetical protein